MILDTASIVAPAEPALRVRVPEARHALPVAEHRDVQLVHLLVDLPRLPGRDDVAAGVVQ